MAKTKNGFLEQIFSFRAPAALRVQLAGDFTHWQMNPVSMRRLENGIGQTKVKLKPGVHHYRIVVDGEWHDDPECTVRVPDEFGTSNMVRKVLTE